MLGANKIIFRFCSAIINEGKQTHLHSVLEELDERSGEQCTLDQVLLIDDQGDNVRTAVSNGKKNCRVSDHVHVIVHVSVILT